LLLPPELDSDPHAPAVPHETLQVTPAFEASLETVAVRLVLLDSATLCGAAMLTDIVDEAVTVATVVAVAGALWASVAFAVAVIVTVPLVGTVDGAL
jgi:hypothetical protein